ncbi:YVTN repeat-like/Quino protein amine dehydrogenase [Pilatotrama ljubarskyi]|nr:YVTN repeat-like/Quino protein amine dehydrogenase [Pilatotrama ljubarskyi]
MARSRSAPATGTSMSDGPVAREPSDVQLTQVSPDGMLVATTHSGHPSVRLWDLSSPTSRKTRTLTIPDGEAKLSGDFRWITWSPSGRYLAYAICRYYHVESWDHAGAVHLWEVKSGQCIRTLRQRPVRSAVRFTPDEREVVYISGTDAAAICRCKVDGSDPQSESESQIIPPELVYRAGAIPNTKILFDGPLWQIALSSDSQLLLTTGPVHNDDIRSLDSANNRDVARVLDYGTAQVLWRWSLPCQITSVAFSPDSSRVLLGLNDGNIYLYELRRLSRQYGEAHPGQTLARYPTLLSSLQLTSLRVYDAGPKFSVDFVGFSSDGRGIFTQSSYIPLDHALRPLRHASSASNSPSNARTYFLERGWLWHVRPGLSSRPICWVPPNFRYYMSDGTVAHTILNKMDNSRDTISFVTTDDRLVILRVQHPHCPSSTR